MRVSINKTKKNFKGCVFCVFHIADVVGSV